MSRKIVPPTGADVNTNDLITVKKALRELNIKASTFYVACKRHQWLKDAIVELYNDDVERNVKYITRSAIERYANERKSGGSANHDGTLKHTLWLADGEVEEAAELLSKAFGRPITIVRLYRSKSVVTITEVDADEDEDA